MKKEKITIEQTDYIDSTAFKYKNARVCVFSLSDDGYGLQFKRLIPASETVIINPVFVERGIRTTVIKITPEAAVSLMLGLHRQLQKDGIIE